MRYWFTGSFHAGFQTFFFFSFFKNRTTVLQTMFNVMEFWFYNDAFFVEKKSTRATQLYTVRFRKSNIVLPLVMKSREILVFKLLSSWYLISEEESLGAWFNTQWGPSGRQNTCKCVFCRRLCLAGWLPGWSLQKKMGLKKSPPGVKKRGWWTLKEAGSRGECGVGRT